MYTTKIRNPGAVILKLSVDRTSLPDKKLRLGQHLRFLLVGV